VYSQNLPVFNFVNWHRYPNHELRLKDLALELGFSHVSMSSEVMPMIRAVPRGFTTAADAYLTPLIRDYLSVNEAIQCQDEVFNYIYDYTTYSKFDFRASHQVSQTLEIPRFCL
jgi:hypothetical protein